MAQTSPDSGQVQLPYPLPPVYDPVQGQGQSGLYLNDPSNVNTNIEYDPQSGDYFIDQKAGDVNFRNPTYMSFDEYQDWSAKQSMRNYWRERTESESLGKRKPLIPALNVKSKLFETIFGGSTIEIKPQGSAELIFGVNVSKIDNPALPANQKTNTTFNFDQNIQMNVIGKIGDKIQLGVNYNTNAGFDFENQMKLEYTGDEDEIIQKIEAGNVSLPLTGTLINGSQNLFGVKAALKFGRLTVTGLFSQQRGQTNTVEVQGGAQVTKFEVRGDNYEANRHFFLSQHFRNNYDQWLGDLPVVRSPINITRVEVWVTSVQFQQESRNIAAFMDLGEVWNGQVNNAFNNTPMFGPGTVAVPDNRANGLYQRLITQYAGIRNIANAGAVFNSAAQQYNFINSQDYETLELATRLNPSEYRLNAQLGYISLNRELQPFEVLAVAYQYTYNGQVFQVGEFSTDGVTGQDALIVKMLKGTVTYPKLPMWDLMMKNVYNIGAYQLAREDFRLDVIYDNVQAGTKTNFIPEGAINGNILLRVMNLDRLNPNNDPFPDGYFDFVEGVTVSSQNGRIIFPVVEPFGSHLYSKFNTPAEDAIAKKYVYQQLYDSTHQAALNYPQLNRFILAGQYKGAGGSEISLGGMNIPQGSVTVTAGSTTLVENVDYTVDYTLGKVRIINQSILASGQPIRATSESNSMFSIQQKTLAGVHLDYVVSKDFSLGATVLNLSERPLTQKVNQGEEPINNTIWGINGNYRTESRLLTKLVDMIPLINTKEISTISVAGEFAHLIPGNARAITQGGISYIDDFEGSVNFIDLKAQQQWVHASTPQGQPKAWMFPEGDLHDNLGYGMNRARIAWYIIDPLFFRNNSLTPSHITQEDQSYDYARQVIEQEIFPSRQPQLQGQQTNLPVFDVAYYPRDRGVYNYDADGNTTLEDGTTRKVASGVAPDGTLKDPATRWGGIMRAITTSDFEQNNIEFIQFWLMDPYHNDQNNHEGGDLYFNLGNVSEDILRDGKKAFENGLPTPSNPNEVDTTAWGIVPRVQALLTVFDNDPTTREFQDVGLDGLNDEQEREFFEPTYISKLDALRAAGQLSQAGYDKLVADPSSDNFKYYRGTDLDNAQVGITERFRPWNGLENNSPTADQTGTDFQASNSTLPNVEDINRDNTVSQAENYFQYRVSLRKEDLVVGRNYITNEQIGQGTLANGNPISVKWYQFKVPIQEPDEVVGNIQDFRSVRFVRMFMKNFEDSVYLRFARLELVRGEWRRYLFNMQVPGEYIPDDNGSGTLFDISTVNIEENGTKDPVNYILPPGIYRQSLANSPTTQRQLNEQSLLLKVCGLIDGDARAAFKNTQFDLRSYKRLKMFIHAEAVAPEILNDGDVQVFLRLGPDFDQNYYEYIVPVVVTPPGNYGTATSYNSDDQYAVWPLLNNIDVLFDELREAKLARDRALINDPTVSVTKPYAHPHGPRNLINVRGNPNLANVKSLMIGIRNPKKTGPADGDDGMAKCAEIWVNELRLTDFDNKGGWAATGQAQVQLADVANVNVATSFKKFGFGDFDSKPSQRLREDILNYELSGTVQLGRFTPKKWAINAPMYLSYAETYKTPEFNPLNPDITMAASLDELNAQPNAEVKKDSLRMQAQGYEKRRSMNFTDLRKGRTGKGKPMPWDVSNLAFNYAYTDQYLRDITYEYNETRTYKGGMTYDYKPPIKPVQPFTKLPLTNKMVDSRKAWHDNRVKEQRALLDTLRKTNAKGAEIKEVQDELDARAERKQRYEKWSRNFLRSGWLRPIKDFNFNYGPNQLSFRTDLDRRYTETQLRNTSDYPDIKILPTYQKSFLWNRQYSLKYDLTKAIKIQFDAFNYARVDEPEGVVDKNASNWNHMRDSIWDNILQGGRTTQYNHTTNVSWTLPINKVPITEWITATAQYTANYTWNAAPLARNPTSGAWEPNSFGNNIQNSQNWQINGNANMNQLYSKIPWIKDLNNKRRTTAPNARDKAQPAKPTDGNAAATDSTKKKNPQFGKKLLEGFGKILTSLKTVNITYSETNGTGLPGYRPKTSYIGIDDQMENVDGLVPFLFGWQRRNPGGYDIRREAVNGNWITNDTLQSAPLLETFTQNLNARASLEPFSGFRVDLTATRTMTESISEFFRWNNAIDAAETFNRTKNGNFSISTVLIGTSFSSINADKSSPVFQQFRDNRIIIADRLAADYPDVLAIDDTTLFPEGYGPTQTDVLIPAFLAAYQGTDAKTIDLTYFPVIPLPNWRVTYDGLSKLKFLKKLFKSITLGHGYRGTYSVSSFTTNLLYRSYDGSNPKPRATDANGDFIPELQVTNITVTEQFSPLFSIDMQWNNSLLTRFEFKKSRNLSMNFSNTQLTEVLSEEYVFGAGYTIKNVKFPIKFGKFTKRIVSDLKLQFDVAIRDNVTYIRKMVEGIDQATAGQQLISIKFNADYVISERISLRLFYDGTLNNPKVSSSFPTQNHAAGLSLRFTLAQ